MTDKSFTPMLNNTHCSDLNTNMEYTYSFNSGFEVKPGSKICLVSLSIPYSWFNITQRYGNNTFSYIYAGVQYNITIPDGYYSADYLQAYFQQMQIERNQYLIDSTTGEYLYFFNFIQNINTYSNQFYFFPVPTVGNLPLGYNAPEGFVYSTDNSCPQLIINNQAFGDLIGYLIGTYPSTKQFVSNDVLGNKMPNLSPVSCLVMRCTMVNNDIGFPSDIITSIPITNASFGSQLQYNPNWSNYISLKEGIYTNMVITLCDQNFNTIYATANDLCINMSISVPI